MRLPSRAYLPSSVAAALAIGFSTALLPAQSGGVEREAVPLLGPDWRVPIHAELLESGAAPERWAAGAGYKASFHDGFTFYPVLGPEAERHLPLRWQLVSVRAGGEDLFHSQPPEHAHDDWRYEYRYGAFTEAYEVRPDGVEQTFTFAFAAGDGDLVVRGKFDTELEAEPVAGRHRSLLFRDAAGRAVVEYGAATAIDAAGRALPLATEFDGEQLELRVPASWLEGARYPVVIDPLTTGRLIGQMSATVEQVHLAREAVSTSGNLMMCLLRDVTANDRDVYAYLLDDGFTNVNLVYSRIGTTSASAPRAAYVGNRGRWVVAHRDIALNGTGSVRIFVLPRQSTTLNNGTLLTVPASYGDVVSVSVGGALQDNRALVAFVTRIAGNPSMAWDVRAVVVDVRTPYFERYIQLSRATTTNIGDHFPQDIAVNQSSEDGVDGWALTWTNSWSNLSTGYSLWAARAYWNGQHNAMVVELGGPPSGGGWRGEPRIDGTGGRYMIAYRVTTDRVLTRRLDWPSQGTARSGVRREHLSNPILTTWHGNTYDIAFDTNTRSHWVLSMRFPVFQGASAWVTARRLGHSGGRVEVANVATDNATVSTPGVCYDATHDAFQFAYNATQSGLTGSWGKSLVHDPALGIALYGQGCGGTISASTPWAGHDAWQIRLQSAPYTPAALAIALAPASLPLGAGCFVNVDLATVIGTPALGTNEFGISQMTFALPDSPAFVGDLYMQWAHVPNGQLQLTRGLTVRVRP